MSDRPLRWGFLSTALIGRHNWASLRASGSGVLAAVASRERARAEQFIAENQASAPLPTPPRALGSYEELLAAPDIDAVYIPLPTGLRKEWVIRAAGAGKHVLCEKPCAPSAADLREMIAACRRARVLFMDGVLFMHSARLPLLRSALNDPGRFGRLRRLACSFTFQGSGEFFAKNIRADRALEPLGCLGDLGWYCIRLALWANHWQSPTAVSGRTLASDGRPGSPGKVPTDFEGELTFPGGALAHFRCSFLHPLQQWARFEGDRGEVSLDDFVLTRDGEVAFTAAGRRVVVPERGGPRPAGQEVQMFRDFAAAAANPDDAGQWADYSLKTQEVTDACYRAGFTA